MGCVGVWRVFLGLRREYLFLSHVQCRWRNSASMSTGTFRYPVELTTSEVTGSIPTGAYATMCLDNGHCKVEEPHGDGDIVGRSW